MLLLIGMRLKNIRFTVVVAITRMIYGWFIDESSSPNKVYHSGSNGGFRTFSFTIPDEGYVIVVFSNRTGIDLENVILEINKILRPGR